MSAELYQHALDCGLDMTGSTAVELEYAYGLTLTHKVYDPEYQDLLLRSGTCLTHRLIDWLRSFGIDYVCVVKA